MSRFESLEKRVAASLPLPVYQAIVRRELTIFVYHMVSPRPPDYIKHIYPSKTPGEFEADLRYLQARFNPISYDQLVDHERGGRELPAKACLVTMDDGYRECFTEAAPLLQMYGVPCVFFLTTGFLDNRAMFYRNKYSLCVEAILGGSPGLVGEPLAYARARGGQGLEGREGLLDWLRDLKSADEGILDGLCKLLGVDIQAVLRTQTPYLTRDQVRSLAEAGFAIGAHSVSHPKFQQLEDRAVQQEILASCRDVASITGGQEIPFAFPFSGAGVDRAWLADLRRNNPLLGPVFETQGLRPEAKGVYNRIWADPPPGPHERASNLETLLHEAYQSYAVWRRKYVTSMVASRLGWDKASRSG